MSLNRVLITGGTGTVGRHLLHVLRERVDRVFATSREQGDITPRGFTFLPMDLSRWDRLTSYSRNFGPLDAIFHVGAAIPTPNDDIDENHIITANVTATRKLGTVALEYGIPIVYLSGAVVYGSNDWDIKETAPISATPEGGLYGLSKGLGEMVLQNLVPQGLKLTILRATSIYGYGMKDYKLIPKMLTTAHNGGTIKIREPISDSINFIHASDVAEAMWLGATKQGVFNVGAKEATRLSDLAKACVDVVGRGRVEIDGGNATLPSVRRFSVDVSLAEKELGFTPKITLNDGLSATIMRKMQPQTTLP